MSASLIAKEISQYIIYNFLNNDERGFDIDTDLQQNGILDSFSTFALIAFIDERFAVNVNIVDINTDNFRTVNTITALVQQMQKQQNKFISIA
ncbi:MAG: hypothetical protein JW841_07110 [Deltaproteobacteria bacterium]|nr:hypothetical protein [Deltaproteobacteria bacterium]